MEIKRLTTTTEKEPKGEFELYLWELNEIHDGLQRTRIKFSSIKNDKNRHFGDDDKAKLDRVTKLLEDVDRMRVKLFE